MNDEIGVYIHIPFCLSKCYYCNFCSYEKKEEYINEYIDALLNEILYNSDLLSNKKIKTIYIGGGTPSYIDSKYIVKIMSVLSMFLIDKDIEITIEINPNSLNEEKLCDYISCGINRFSIGLQSVYDDVLKSIGRVHTYNDFLKCMELFNKKNIENVSVDLIYPLPNQDYTRFKDEIDQIIKLSKKYPLKHISVYNLELHEGLNLEFLIKEGYLSLSDEDEEYKMTEYLNSCFEKNGFNKYEISNYSLKGYESKHNLNYWNQGEYLGFGLGSSSFMAGVRYTNTKNIDEYIKYYCKNDNNVCVRNIDEEMDMLDLMKEYVMLRLRLSEGVIIQDFKRKYGKDIFEIFSSELNELKNMGLINILDNNICLTKRGEEVANIVFEKFI